ncbi:hypothetical protein HOP50_02g17390 [Chloropicon primus]|uniref:Uncharacterized protein n=1 Tax=Chloropicon primus TaxID=1764295 RepID=A0A5B8MGL8_9CHLO|nr:hypothetical protein A3770_02p17420 [Chloropicon primus]UPQ98433.1 hypothetical protein HOP50_02g17390 [Chloropicon primus]|eukprot:QDZ19224.1 hypothetical protein A3770_02p17420 [Chloropicon primus]
MDANQSKALLKLGVATDLGTAIRTNKSFSKVASSSPETRRADKLLQDFIRSNPNRHLDLKQLDRLLVQKIQKDIEARAMQKKPSRVRVSVPPGKPAARAVARTPKPPASAKLEEGGTDDAAGGEVVGSRATTAESSRRSPDGRSTAARAGTGATTRAATARAEAGVLATTTADKSSEIDIVNLDEALGEINQAKPMVLNLEELMDSTLEVLEYEASRPLEPQQQQQLEE